MSLNPIIICNGCFFGENSIDNKILVGKNNDQKNSQKP